MNQYTTGILGMVLASGVAFGAEQQAANIQAVAATKGLVAFWDFKHVQGGTWGSFHDPELQQSSYPLYLKRIGDPMSYSMSEWPYTDAESELIFDGSGPFGTAVRFNKGYIYGAVERSDFDGTLLDIHGTQPFTVIAWVKFIGFRHMVAGIWDEGGWDKYGGRRQIALFSGLFRQRSVIIHISATGAASYPQSVAQGAQYARLRAIDGMPFDDNQWVSMAAVYCPERQEVVCYLNGVMTPMTLTDPVARDVYQYTEEQPANPFRFSLPIYSPRNFIIKYNGINSATSKIREHRLQVNLDERMLTYEQEGVTGIPDQRFRVTLDIRRGDQSLLAEPVQLSGIRGQTGSIPADMEVVAGDEVRTWLESEENEKWQPVGTVVKRRIEEGAPFTFGRALGLGDENPEHGSQLYIDGVAVFNRVLTDEEIQDLSFVQFSGCV